MLATQAVGCDGKALVEVPLHTAAASWRCACAKNMYDICNTVSWLCLETAV